MLLKWLLLFVFLSSRNINSFVSPSLWDTVFYLPNFFWWGGWVCLLHFLDFSSKEGKNNPDLSPQESNFSLSLSPLLHAGRCTLVTQCFRTPQSVGCLRSGRQQNNRRASRGHILNPACKFVSSGRARPSALHLWTSEREAARRLNSRCIRRCSSSTSWGKNKAESLFWFSWNKQNVFCFFCQKWNSGSYFYSFLLPAFPVFLYCLSRHKKGYMKYLPFCFSDCCFSCLEKWRHLNGIMTIISDGWRYFCFSRP